MKSLEPPTKRSWITEQDIRDLPHLTPRQVEIIEHVALKCQSKKEIAADLHRSNHTINQHLRNIYDQLGITKMSELVKYYYVMKIREIRDWHHFEQFRRNLAIVALVFVMGMDMMGVSPIRVRTPQARTVFRTEARAKKKESSEYPVNSVNHV